MFKVSFLDQNQLATTILILSTSAKCLAMLNKDKMTFCSCTLQIHKLGKKMDPRENMMENAILSLH
jgi:hypothetical protein